MSEVKRMIELHNEHVVDGLVEMFFGPMLNTNASLEDCAHDVVIMLTELHNGNFVDVTDKQF